jgi:hypothetical protein
VEFFDTFYKALERQHSGLLVEESTAIGERLPSGWRNLRYSLGLALWRILIFFSLE